MNKKAILLLSGGLDSILAGKIVKEQGIELEALNFVTIFCNCTSKNSCKHEALKASENLGIPLRVDNITEEYLSVVKNPKHGYGSSMNPCLDCRILIFKKAKKMMEDCGASFIVTGEVLGERPMSQRRPSIELIEKESGLKGLILRPLSAKFFPATLAEEAGIIDRKKLFSIKGRCRKGQISLAKELKINEYPCPSGGCLLTDKIFGIKIKDLIKYDSLTSRNAMLLKFGKHFRLSAATKLIVGRDEKENIALMNMSKDGEIMFETQDIAGPLAILMGSDAENFIEIAAGLVSRYSDNPNKTEIKIEYWQKNSPVKLIISAKPLEESFIEKTKIG